MNDAPFPQTLPQQLRELGVRWRVSRLKQIYTTPIGRWGVCLLFWITAVGLLNRIAMATLNLDAAASLDSWQWSLTLILHNIYYYAELAVTVAMVVWFQCCWPTRGRWVLFVVMAVGYAVFMQVLQYLPPYSDFSTIAMDSAENAWAIVTSVLYLVGMLMVVRIGNVFVRLYLVQLEAVDEEAPLTSQLSKHNSWSLQGFAFTVLMVAVVLACIKQSSVWEEDMALFDFNQAFLVMMGVSSAIWVILPIIVMYFVARDRIGRQRIRWWSTFAIAAVVPRLMTEVLYLCLPATAGIGYLRSPFWVDASGMLTYMLAIGAFFAACERSGYGIVMWVRGRGLMSPSELNMK